MANYKVVFRSDNQSTPGAPGWEPGCPLLINTVQVSRNTETGQCYLQLNLSNISGEIVGGCQLEATVTYADGSTESVEPRLLDADIRPGDIYRPNPVLLRGSEIAEATARVRATSQASGPWRSTGTGNAIPAGAPLGLEEAAAAERALILTAMGKRPEAYSRRLIEEEGWWICPCGAPNVGRAACHRCAMARNTLRQLEDEDYLHAKTEKRHAAEKARRRKRRSIIVILIAIIVAVLSMGLLNEFAIQPELQRRAAEQAALEAAEQEAQAEAEEQAAIESANGLFSSGNYEQAAASYEELGMTDQALESMYLYVQENLDRENETTRFFLEELVKLNYKDSSSIESTLYAVSFDFSLCDMLDYFDAGQTWMPNSESVRNERRGGAALLVRAQGGKPGATYRLSIDWEAVVSKSQTTYEGYVFKRDSHDSLEVPADGTIAYSSPDEGSYYRDAWRVTVTNPENAEALFSREIQKRSA